MVMVLHLMLQAHGFRILCILKILSKPQEASRGFEGVALQPSDAACQSL